MWQFSQVQQKPCWSSHCLWSPCVKWCTNKMKGETKCQRHHTVPLICQLLYCTRRGWAGSIPATHTLQVPVGTDETSPLNSLQATLHERIWIDVDKIRFFQLWWGSEDRNTLWKQSKHHTSGTADSCSTSLCDTYYSPLSIVFFKLGFIHTSHTVSPSGEMPQASWEQCKHTDRLFSTLMVCRASLRTSKPVKITGK